MNKESACWSWKARKERQEKISDCLSKNGKHTAFCFSAIMSIRFSLQSFWYFAWSRSREIQVNPRNPAKFTKTRKIPRNAVEILSNTCPYSNFETCLSYWGYLLAVNSQIYVKTSSLKRANNVPKLPGVDYVAKNWALAMMLKALPLVHFWSVLLLKEQMMTSVRKTLKTLVWSTQNRSISSEVCPENNHKIRRFFTNCFSTKFVPKIPAKFREIGRFFRDFVPKNPAKFDFFFPQSIRSPVFGRLNLLIEAFF